jgi:hexosaminidase
MYRDAGVSLTTVHIGGDEVPPGVWEKSPAAQALIAERSELASTDDLWAYYVRRVAAILKARDIHLAGWEEIGMHPVRRDGAVSWQPNREFAGERFQLYVWNNVLGWGAEDLAYRLANLGYPVVLVPVSNLYFDLAYEKDFYEPGYYWGGFVDVDQPFSFAPFDYLKTAWQDRMGNRIDPAQFAAKERLTDRARANIVGIQGALWAENLKSRELLEYMAFPKLLALAERAWAPAPDWESASDTATLKRLYAASWADFANRLGQRELPRLDFFKGGTAYRIPPPGAIIEKGMLYANVQFPGLALRYTTDGTEPTADSPLYEGPVTVQGPVKIRAFDRRGHGGRVTTVP